MGLALRRSSQKQYNYTNGEYVFAFPIDWVAETLEITLAQHYASSAPKICQIRGKLDFHGMEIRPEKIAFVGFLCFTFILFLYVFLKCMDSSIQDISLDRLLIKTLWD